MCPVRSNESVLMPKAGVGDEIRKLRQQHEHDADAGDNGTIAAGIAHEQRHQPAAEPIGPGRDREKETRRQGQQQDHPPRRGSRRIPRVSPTIQGTNTMMLKVTCEAT